MALHTGPLPSGLSSDDYLLLLVALLSDIISLVHSVGPLLEPEASPRDQALPGRTQHASANHGISNDHDRHPPYSNPLLPFCATSEFKLMRRRFRRGLKVWCASVGLFEDRKPAVDSTVIPLMYFCHMMLECGPEVGVLPALAGYKPESHQPSNAQPDGQASRTSIEVTLHFSDAALSDAWQVLETIEAQDHYGDDPSRGTGIAPAPSRPPITPIWYPLVVFYAALVVWARMKEDRENKRGTGGVLLARKKLLGTFQTELEQMKPRWGCTKRMIDCIKALK